MKVSDYVMRFISGLGVDKIFCVTGGGAMHLNNSLGASEDIEGVFMLHEQGASVAAESYARIREGYGVCLVTSGPGGTNAITGLCGAYMDSIPLIFISGQAKRADLVGDQNIRQFGIQEVDIISMVRPYTKYAVQISRKEDVRYELEKAAHLAISGRPGAVWIDIPLDIQASDVDAESLNGFEENEKKACVTAEEISLIIDAYNKAKKPALVLGHGVRLAHAADKARILAELLQIPVFVSWNGVDLMESDHPLFYGRPNVVGHRSANLILQNADFVLSIGTRLSLLNTGYNFDGYLKNAFHVMVDIDENEMNKKSLHPQMKIVSDAGLFIDLLLGETDRLNRADHSEWLKHCDEISERFPVMIKEQDPRAGFVNLYHLFDVISDEMSGDDIYQFTSSGTTVDIGMKALRLKRGQRAFLNKSMAAMGYDIPASVGSCIGSGKKRVICVTGDGSAVMNMQELEVIKRLNLPVKIFVADNNGYSMIWHSQNGNFKGHLTGCTEESGLTLPNMKLIAESFGIHATEITDETDLRAQVKEVLEYDGPVVCRVNADIMQKVLPKQSNFMNAQGQMESRPLQDMEPLIDRDELEECMSWNGTEPK
ncbi:MAG: thiamine pyrophosphate-binding protein [Lachnospiraceae bacterium]|nr:thiamine pyrophosphate-binding protein [Lachnospiraceae bacterium]